MVTSQSRKLQDTNQGYAKAPANQVIDNIVLFGAGKSGKRSLTNLIAGKSIMATSDSYLHMPKWPTFRHDEVVIGGKTYRIWNTSGFEPIVRGHSSLRLREAVNRFLRALSQFGGISLLLFCIRAGRLNADFITFYNIFYSGICRKKVPIIIVFTSMNHKADPRPEQWWVENEKEVHKQVHFDGHLCVNVLDSVTARTMSPAIQRLLQESAHSARIVIASNCRRLWKIDEASWLSTAVPDVHFFMNSEIPCSTLIPNVIVYNTPETFNPSLLTNSDSTTQVSSKPTLAFQSVEINDNTSFNVYNIPGIEMVTGRHLYSRTFGRRPDLLIFCASHGNTTEDTHKSLEKFYTSWEGQTTPLLVVVKGADTHEAAAEWWRKVFKSLNHGSEPGFIVQLGFLPERSQDTAAREHLLELIQRFCLKPVSYSSRRGFLTRWSRQAKERQDSQKSSFEEFVASLAYTTTDKSVFSMMHDVTNN